MTVRSRVAKTDPAKVETTAIVPVDKPKRDKPTQKQREVAATKRRAEVAKLILRGYTYGEMAKLFDVSKTTIAKDVKGILAMWVEEMKPEQRTDWIIKEMSKLDRMERGIAEKSENGDGNSIDRRLKIMDRRAKMLGIDAPQRLQVGQMDIEAAIALEIERAAALQTHTEGTNGDEKPELERLAPGSTTEASGDTEGT